MNPIRFIIVPGILLTALCLFGQTNPSAKFILARGARAGEAVAITNIHPQPKLVLSRDEHPPAFVSANIAGTNLLVELSASSATLMLKWKDGKEHPCDVVEFRINAKLTNSFQWSCWTYVFPRPQSFQVLTTQLNKSYACFVGAGVELFALTKTRSSQAMLEAWIVDHSHPDAFPPLFSELSAAIPASELKGKTLETAITVVSLDERSGELSLTLRGSNPKKRYSFALRQGKWVATK